MGEFSHLQMTRLTSSVLPKKALPERAFSTGSRHLLICQDGCQPAPFFAFPVQPGAQVGYGFGSFIGSNCPFFGFGFGSSRALLCLSKFVAQDPDFICFCARSNRTVWGDPYRLILTLLPVPGPPFGNARNSSEGSILNELSSLRVADNRPDCIARPMVDLLRPDAFAACESDSPAMNLYPVAYRIIKRPLVRPAQRHRCY